ncbi:MAG TPA: hypothetical protein IAB49_00880 [Candidatus Caccenecus avistercoris]|nr:hypothetical protein [Candidatus Caccenecus avistercoris]
MENKYYLAVEVKPKNYFPIDLLNLKIANSFTSTNLEELDAFTQKFTKKEIMDAIKEANLLEVEDTMPLVVIYYEKKNTRKMDALTKDNYYDMWQLLNANYTDKVFVNKVVNFLNKKIDAQLFNRIKISQSKNEFLSGIGSLPYVIQRRLYLYLYE